MRTIKFRAWDGEKMYDWNYLKGFTSNWLDSDDRKGSFKPMQFTGLLDKNGKEIFEGDVVRILYTDWASKPEDDPRTIEQYLIEDKCHVGEVVYKPVEFLIDFHTVGKWGGDSCGYLKSGQHGWIEVIGNVWENPELLEKESV